jgi:hypothetical protein
MNPEPRHPHRSTALIAALSLTLTGALVGCGGDQAQSPVAQAETIAAPTNAAPPTAKGTSTTTNEQPAATPPSTVTAPIGTSTAPTTPSPTPPSAVTSTTQAPESPPPATTPVTETIPTPATTSVSIDGGTAILSLAEGRKDALCLVVEGTSLGQLVSACGLTKQVMTGAGLTTIKEDPSTSELAVIGYAPPRLYTGVRVGSKTVALRKGFYKTVLHKDEKQVRLVRNGGTVEPLQVRA